MAVSLFTTLHSQHEHPRSLSEIPLHSYSSPISKCDSSNISSSQRLPHCSSTVTAIQMVLQGYIPCISVRKKAYPYTLSGKTAFLFFTNLLSTLNLSFIFCKRCTSVIRKFATHSSVSHCFSNTPSSSPFSAVLNNMLFQLHYLLSQLL